MANLPHGDKSIMQVDKATNAALRNTVAASIMDDLQAKGLSGDVLWFVALPLGQVDICPQPGGGEKIQQTYGLPEYERFGPHDPAREDMKSFYEGPSISISDLLFWITYQMRYLERTVLEHDGQDDIYNSCRQYIKSEGMKHVEQARKDIEDKRVENLIELLIKHLDYEQ